MQNPLLLGESSGAGDGSSGSSRRRDGMATFTRRSDAITRGSRYQKAAALVDLAEDGVGLPEEILDRPDFESAANLYFVFIQFDFLWTLNYFALILLNFFEKPLWCGKNSAYSCSDRDYYYLGQLPYLTGSESLILEGVTLVILVAHIFFPISYEGPQIYWKNFVNRLKVICLSLLAADLLVYALYLSPVALDSLPLRIAPYIRVVIFILSIRDLQRSVRILAGMLGTYLNVLALWLLFLLFSSWLAYVIFEDTQQGKTVFSTYGATLYQMLLLFTTSNNPDVWIPAYKASRWSYLFNVLYLLVGVYFVTNLILAVVYDSFKSQLAKQVSEMDCMRRRILTKAFSLIDIYNAGFLNKEQCIKLFEELNNYRTLPKISKEEFELIFDELDDSRDFKINLDEFVDLCHAIALRFQKEDVPSCFEKCPSIYHSSFSEKLKTSVQSPTFGYIISFILMLNLIAVIIETTLDIENNSAQKVWQSTEFVFGYGVVAFGAGGYGISFFFLVCRLPDPGWIYVLEMALKFYSYGFSNYWRDGQNRFDFVITLVVVIGETLTFTSPNGLTFLSNGEWIRYLLLARMLRLIRILMYVRNYRAFIATFLTLLPSLMPYLGMIFCVMCIYCSLGVQIFGGLVNAGDPTVREIDLAKNDYLLFNFNDYPNGMVTIFNLLVMGNWQVWMQSYKQLTGTSWALAYFISFYLIAVLLLLNLVVAFVLEAFFAEMELEMSENHGEENKDAKNMKDQRRYVGTKTRSQRVDMLLHHMLSAELDQSYPSNA